MITNTSKSITQTISIFLNICVQAKHQFFQHLHLLKKRKRKKHFKIILISKATFKKLLIITNSAMTLIYSTKNIANCIFNAFSFFISFFVLFSFFPAPSFFLSFSFTRFTKPPSFFLSQFCSFDVAYATKKYILKNIYIRIRWKLKYIYTKIQQTKIAVTKI